MAVSIMLLLSDVCLLVLGTVGRGVRINTCYLTRRLSRRERAVNADAMLTSTLRGD